MGDDDRRKHDRFHIPFTSFIQPGAGSSEDDLIQFNGEDISYGGLFVTAEDLALFEIGETLDLMVDLRGNRIYDGKARVVREEPGDGYGIMFLQPSKFKRTQVDPEMMIYGIPEGLED